MNLVSFQRCHLLKIQKSEMHLESFLLLLQMIQKWKMSFVSFLMLQKNFPELQHQNLQCKIHLHLEQLYQSSLDLRWKLGHCVSQKLHCLKIHQSKSVSTMMTMMI
jgi:hypothetical protein